MTLLKQAIMGIMWLEIIVVSLFLAACAVGVVCFGYVKWSERKLLNRGVRNDKCSG